MVHVQPDTVSTNVYNLYHIHTYVLREHDPYMMLDVLGLVLTYLTLSDSTNWWNDVPLCLQMSGPTFPIGTMINEMFVLAFLVVVESVRLLLGQQHEPVSFIGLFMHNLCKYSRVSNNHSIKEIQILFELL